MEPGETGMKVLFLVSHLHKGGMQRALSNVSVALPDHFEQQLGFFGTEEPGFDYRAKPYSFDLPGAPQMSAVRKAVNLGLRLHRLRKHVARHGIDAVVSFGESANFYNLAALHSARKVISIRVDVEAHLRQMGWHGYVLNRLVGALYPSADSVVAVSEGLAEYARRRWPRLAGRIEVISNLYHIDSIRRSAREPLPDAQRLRFAGRRMVLAVGSLAYQKGFDLLIAAFARCGVADSQLVIMGRGEWREKLLALAEANGIADRVTIVDYDPNPYRLMARADLFVLSSRFEGFPNVLVEAMACGAPVVAFDCSTGPREILGDGVHGILVPANDCIALADAMRKVLGSRTYAGELSGRSIKRALDFDAPRIVPRWIEVLSGRSEWKHTRPVTPTGACEKVLAVVVAYRCAWTDVRAAGTLTRIVGGPQRPDQRLQLSSVLIYDNSPEPSARPLQHVDGVEYRHDPSNSGTRGAYAHALNLASASGCDWILLLDQDTEIPVDYLDSAARALNSSDARSIAAVLPKVRADGRVISPGLVTLAGFIKPLGAAASMRESTPRRGNVTAIASGSLIRSSALAVGLPPEQMWLDYVDHWIFRQLGMRGWSVVTMDAVLEHDLSVQHMKTVTRARLYSILDAELAFTRSLGPVARLALPLRWAARLLRLSLSHPSRAGDMLSWVLRRPAG
jgi:glycosyltransferase involved in cell wall biosynthesis